MKNIIWLIVLALVLGTGAARADGTISISSTVIHDHKGWGLFPAQYDRQLPTQADGTPLYGDASWLPASGATPSTLHQVVCDLGFDIARVYISPTIGKPDGTLDAARLQDFKDHLSILKSQNVTQYGITVWSPPAYMKLPDHVRFGLYQGRRQYLDPAFADSYADYLVAVTKALTAAGFVAPVYISIQNEVDLAPAYDGCIYIDTDAQKQTYRTVVKQLRAKMDANGLGSVKILATESSGLDDVTNILGAASATGFANMNADTSFRDAVGAFAWHPYYTSPHIGLINSAMAAYPGRDRWVTEYSKYLGIRGEIRPSTGNFQLDSSFDFVRRMASDEVDHGVNYWFFWRGWHSSSTADDEHLVYGDAQKAKAYYIFQKLWKTVRPGWRVKKVATTDPDLVTGNSALIAQDGNGNQMSRAVDILAFENATGTQSCLMIANWKGVAKSIVGVFGLMGTSADVFQTTSSQDMIKVTTRSVSGGALGGGALSVPAYSISFVITNGNTIPSPTPTPTSAPTPIPTSAAKPAPYGSAPISITSSASVVEAENYDWGGEGVAFHQAFSGAQTGYRPDNNSALYNDGAASNSYSIGWAQGGQWLGYTINVGVAGKYDIALSANSGAGGGSLHMESGPVGQVGGGGTTTLGTFTVPVTGNWTGSYTTIKLNGVSLATGTQWLRVIEDTGGYNLDKITFVPSASSGVPARLAIASATTTATGYNFDKLANSYDGQIPNIGSLNCFRLVAGDSATYTLSGGKTVTRFDLSLAFSGAKHLQVEAQVGGAWQTLVLNQTVSNTPGSYVSYSLPQTANVSALRVSAFDNDTYLDDIQFYGF